MELAQLLARQIAERNDLSVFFNNLDAFLAFCAQVYVRRGNFLSPEEIEYLNMQAQKIAQTHGLEFTTAWNESDIRKAAVKQDLLEE